MLPSSVAAARATDALLVLRFRPGQFVLRGEPLAAIVPADNAGAFKAVISRAIHIGSHRTLTQDSEFGIAQVVEIAIRALSPAVNDTFTGVDDARRTDPPARRDSPAGTATSGRLPSSSVGSSGRDPRNRERAGRD